MDLISGNSEDNEDAGNENASVGIVGNAKKRVLCRVALYRILREE